MKKFVQLFLILFILSGCSEYRQIEIRNLSLDSVDFISTTSVSIRLAAEVNNPVDKEVTLESLDVILLNEGKNFAGFKLIGSPVAEAGKVSVVPIDIEAKALDQIALITMGLNFNSWNLDNFTVNGKIFVKFEGMPRKKIVIKNKPLKSLISAVK